MKLIFGVVLLFTFCFTVIYSQKITNLPSYVGPPLSMYSGYVTVDKQHGRNLFYWLLEAQVSPATAPLVIWFQGGPGCSSLFGLFEENGPFKLLDNGSIGFSDLSWNRIANVLYVETPAGVGFSYSNDKNDYNTNDAKAALDNYVFVKNFLEMYPQYKGRSLWLTGESYAGVYIPMLAQYLLSDTIIKPSFKGLMAGNPVINCPTAVNDYLSISFDLLYNHGLVSYSLYNQFASNNCFANNSGARQICNNIYNNMIDQIGVIYQQASDNFPSLDPDDLYQDFCTGNGTLRFAENLYGQCNPLGDRLTTYLNRADVQTAIHAVAAVWDVCNDNLNYTSSGDSLIPYYLKFFQEKPDLNILIYSGDVDVMTVPFAFTKACVHDLQKLKTVTNAWQPWFVNGATAGYVEVYETVTYATIKGAGHEAPQYQPLTALNLFERYLTKQNLTAIEDTPVLGKNGKLNRFVLGEGDILRKLGIRP